MEKQTRNLFLSKIKFCYSYCFYFQSFIVESCLQHNSLFKENSSPWFPNITSCLTWVPIHFSVTFRSSNYFFWCMWGQMNGNSSNFYYIITRKAFMLEFGMNWQQQNSLHVLIYNISKHHAIEIQERYNYVVRLVICEDKFKTIPSKFGLGMVSNSLISFEEKLDEK